MYEGHMDKAKGGRIKGGRWWWVGWGWSGGGKWGQLYLNNNKFKRKKDKERILKPQVKNSYLQGSFHKTVSCFLYRNISDQKGLAQNTQHDGKQGPSAKNTLPSKAVIENGRKNKKHPKQQKARGVHQYQASIIKNVKGVLAGVAQCIESQPVNQGVAGLIPSHGTRLGCRPGPQCVVHKRQPDIDLSLPFSFSSLSLVMDK